MDSRDEADSAATDAETQQQQTNLGADDPDWGINRRIERFSLRLIGGLAAVAVFAFIVYGASYHAAKQALEGNTTSQKPQATAVTVAMHDPGCHWFQVGQQFEKSLSVTGPAKLLNSDEAALRVTMKGMKPIMIPVGQTATVPAGTYKVIMVGQAPDDNTLSLQVS